MPSLGTSFGRGGATTFQQDLQNSDCIVIQGSNMAECHPVAFQWVMEAKARGATLIHVDPRFTRTSALADLHVPLRAGSDIVFLGGLINHVLTNELDFREYVVAYTNAATVLREDFKDTDELDGVFSGFDPERRLYDTHTWQYADGALQDLTLQHPRCVFQVLKRHFARYTPDMVEQICGVSPDAFHKVAAALTNNSGRDRTSAFVYSVGWTQHTVGVQYIRSAAILQTLLGNMGRPGGGILALRGHASIQGSTDIPTLFDILPGYLRMPNANRDQILDEYVAFDADKKGYWGNIRAYVVSLLKAWWGDNARPENDFCFDYLPRLTGDHGTYATVIRQVDEGGGGYFLVGENPAVGSANGKMQRLGMANLDWLVVRDLSLIESATWWLDGPEIETGELTTRDIKTEVFFLPAAAHTEKSGSFTNTQRMLQWHHAAVEPQGDARSELWFYYHLGRIIREKLAESADEIDRPLLDLTWNYPTSGPLDEPSAEAVLAEINGWDANRNALSGFSALSDDGSTACGCWIYCGVFADGVNQAARRKPGSQQHWVAPEWGWAWPMNRRILYNRASADPDGKPWSERKAYVWWDDEHAQWTGHDVPDFQIDKRPDYKPAADAHAQDAIAGSDPFIMQDDGKASLFVPTGLTDGPLPTHYEPQESPFTNLLYGQQHNPARELNPHRYNRYNPSGETPGSEVFPYVFTTYRLTEHHTAGGMSRTLPYLSELQPEFFCEVSPQLARERGLTNGEWATIVTARAAVEARILVTDRITPLRIHGRVTHQVGLPYHWGPNGLATGDAANELLSLALDPNVHIQEAKGGSCDVQPGRRPRGPALLAYLDAYRRRAGITDTAAESGTFDDDSSAR